jgi:hypothetical protein
MAGHDSGVRVKNGPAFAGHGAEAVRDAIERTIATLPAQLRRSLTWDQGAEMTQHARLRIDTGLAVYFCVPTVRGSAARTRTPTGSCARAGDKKPAVHTPAARVQRFVRRNGNRKDRAMRSNLKPQNILCHTICAVI